MSDFDSMIGSMDTPIPGNEAPPPAQRAKEAAPPQPIEPDEPPAEGEAPIEEAPDDLLEDDNTPEPSAIAEAAGKWEELQGSPDLPAELGDKLWTVKNGDREWQVPISEMAKGYMRLNESTRRAQALDQREQQVTQGEQRFQKFFQDIRKPEALIEVLERQLGPETLDAALGIRQKRAEDDSAMIEAAGYAVMRRLGVNAQDGRVREAMMAAKGRLDRERNLDIEQRKLQARNRQLESQTKAADTNQQVEQLRATFQKQLEQLTPLAFKAARIRDNPVNRDRHVQYIKQLAKAQNAQGITRELVQEAARCLRDDLEDERASRAAKPPAAAARTAPKGAGTGVAPTRGHVASGAKSMRDFDAHFGRE
jgi:hypothetical protein